MSGSLYYTDEHTAYGTLDELGTNQVVIHSKDKYVRDDVHINSIEGFWSFAKKICMHTMMYQNHISHYIASILSLDTTTETKICLSS